MHILFAGGGTAGHINPALAVAGYIKEKNPSTKISYIGTATKLEAKLVPAAGYDFYTIDVAGFQRKITIKNIFRNIVAVEKMFSSSLRARKLLKELKHGVTEISVHGMYSDTDKFMLVCIINKRQIGDMMRILKKYPKTFSSFVKVNEVFGNFKRKV